jgi:hypothetical protein
MSKEYTEYRLVSESITDSKCYEQSYACSTKGSWYFCFLDDQITKRWRWNALKLTTTKYTDPLWDRNK